MKRQLISLIAVAVLAQAAICSGLEYHDASQLKVIGKPTWGTDTLFYRLPDTLCGVVRKPLWDLGRNSAGIAVRFRSNTTTIGARWTVWNNFAMNHMTATGVRGLDLYAMEPDGRWTFVNSARPGTKPDNTSTIMSNMTADMREYMLYLPLYDGCKSLEIGIDSTAVIEQPAVNLPLEEKPVVWYGTSITQGGCASRPGMAATNIVERELNRVVINLGFSGNGRLDPEIARVMAAIDAGMYILDCLPNVTIEQIKERTEAFYGILRAAHPTTPILMVRTPEFPNKRFNTEVRRVVNEKDAAWREFYRRFRAAGDSNVHFIDTTGMIGDDGEATVDCAHFTDLGFERCAAFMLPELRRYLE